MNETKKIVLRNLAQSTQVKSETAASESGLNGLLRVASRHYAEMSPRFRECKIGELLFQLIEQNKKMVEQDKIMQGQLRVVDEINTELRIIGMTGSIAWKAQMLKLRT